MWRHNKLDDTRARVILFKTEKRQEPDAAQQGEKRKQKIKLYTEYGCALMSNFGRNEQCDIRMGWWKEIAMKETL